jgi:hypothetical protein
MRFLILCIVNLCIFSQQLYGIFGERLDDLILNKKTSPEARQKYYEKVLGEHFTLPHIKFYKILFDLPLISSTSAYRFVALNPSIQKTKDGYVVFCRASTFKQTHGEHYARYDRKLCLR